MIRRATIGALALALAACGGGGEEAAELDEVDGDGDVASAASREPQARRAAPGRSFAVGRSTVRMKLDDTRFDVFVYKPRGPVQGLLLVFHGTDRNAADYRNRAQALADRYGLVVVVPLFDEQRFSTTEYHRANLLPGLPASRWNTRFAPLLLQAARVREGANLPGYVFGFSAGGQYVARVAAVEPMPNVVRMVSGGASTYVLPLVNRYPNGEAAPYGLGELFRPEVEQQRVRDYLAAPYAILCGEQDDDPNAENLTNTEPARRQGATRLQRARYAYNEGQRVARDLGASLAWTFHTVPGVGHSSTAVLRSPELQRALQLPGEAVQL